MKLSGFQTGKECTFVDITSDEGKFRICGISDRVIRCIYTKKEEVTETSSIGIDRNKAAALKTEELENGLEISTEKLTLWIDKEDGRFVWTRREDGSILLEEGEKILTETPVMKYVTDGERPIIRRVKTVDGERNFVENLHAVEDHTAYHAKLSFCWKPGEQIHGLGQGEEGIYNYRRHVQYLYQHNMRIPIPFLVSTQGYGVLVDCGSLMTFNDDERGSYLFCDTVEQLDYYFIAGDTLDAIIESFRELTGRAAMLPKWAFGYVQSKETYKTQDELVETAKKYRETGIGLDCLVQDWKTWPADDWGCKIVDKKRYPDLKEATDKLHEMNVHAMVSVWPNINAGTQDYREMEEAGYLLYDLATYDAFEEEAREIYWKQCNRELFSGGFDAWWCDSTEPFSGPDWNGPVEREPWERYELVGGEHKKFLGADRANLYAVAHAKGIFENQRKTAPDKRVLNLTRSGYAGIQKYGTVLWSGDISARWDVLRAQITEGLNMAMSGMPYWTLDIGAFFTVHKNWWNRGCECNEDSSMKWFWHGDYEDGVQDLGYRELYVRWFEFGAFLPMFRSHGTDTPREIWQFGTPGQPDEIFYRALERTIRDRYRLMPYIYSLAGAVVQEHDTIMRSLLFDFASDARAAASDREYMFGRSLLICPVTSPMYFDKNSEMLDAEKIWPVYLPAGCGWYDFYTGAYYEGGQELMMDVTLDHIPVFVREGSILPMEAGLTYADEQVQTPFELHLYPAKSAERSKLHTFCLYEDAGDDYAYEKGAFNRIGITWDEENQSLTLGEAATELANGLKGRICKAILEGRETIFTYEGTRQTVRLV